MPPLRKPLDPKLYTGQLLLKGTQAKDVEAAKLYAERLARAQARLMRRIPASTSGSGAA